MTGLDRAAAKRGDVLGHRTETGGHGGLPPEGSRARFDPLTLAYLDQRILGSNCGGIRPQIDIPAIIDLVMSGDVLLEPPVSGRRPLNEAKAALDELAGGAVLRTLLIP